MQKATQLLSISILISIVIIIVTFDEWSNFHKKQITQGDVAGVIDSNTLKVIVAGKYEIIRLAYIHCPEEDQADEAAAVAALRNAVEDKSVRLNIVDIDEDEKKIAEVYANDININLHLIRTGMCYADRKNVEGKGEYLEVEDLAQKEGLGVHRSPEITPG
mgnify:CR=1 FL=1